VLVLQRDLVVFVEVAGQGRQAEGREEKREYLIDRQKGLSAAVLAGEIILTFTGAPPFARFDGSSKPPLAVCARRP
jgi:hypothetical protein